MRRRGGRVLEPYPARRQWRLVIVGESGRRRSRFFAAREEAEEHNRKLEARIKKDQRTIRESVQEYKTYLTDDKGNKQVSVKQTGWKLGAFFPDDTKSLTDVTPSMGKALYLALRKRQSKRAEKVLSVDYHRNILAEATTFMDWCVSQGWISRNPLDDVKGKGKGKRKHGKPQLRIDELRLWDKVALQHARTGRAGAVAALMTIYMDMRCSEIVARQVRDLDDGGRLLWIDYGKTDAAERKLLVPRFMQPFLLALAKGRAPTDLLFGKRDRAWPRRWVQRICTEAKVPRVTAHGMRGLHASLAAEQGITPEVIALALGHESPTTTLESYAKKDAVARGRQKRMLSTLAGGAQ